MKFFSALREWLVQDFGWKIFSLLLAAAIWLTIHRIILVDPNAVGTFHGTPITYDNLPVQMVSTRADVRGYHLLRPAVKVTVSGSPEVMTQLQASQIHATVDLTEIDTSRDLRCRVEIYAPPGVTLVSVDPKEIGVIPPARH